MVFRGELVRCVVYFGSLKYIFGIISNFLF